VSAGQIFRTPYVTSKGYVVLIQQGEDGFGNPIFEEVHHVPGSRGYTSARPRQIYRSMPEARRAVEAIYSESVALAQARTADAHAKQVHTWEAWQVAADAFEEAGKKDVAERIRRETENLRTNLSRRELLHVAIRAASRVMEGKRPTEKLFARARIAAGNAVYIRDRLAGTSRHRSVKNQGDIGSIARRAVTLARRLHWGPDTGSIRYPDWAERLGTRRRR